MNRRRAPLLLSLCLAACGAKTAPDAPEDDAASGAPGSPDAAPPPTSDALAASDARLADGSPPGTPDATVAPAGDAAGPPGPGDAAVGPSMDAAPVPGDPDAVAPPPVPDAFMPPPGPPGRVCCVDAAECAVGQHCSGGRCWNDLVAPPCDAATPCADGAACEAGRCAVPCGCVDGGCPPETACITDDRACGVCAPVASLCRPECERDLTSAAWVHLAADPLMDARPEVVTGTLLSDARMPGGVGRRFELALEDGSVRGFVYVVPAPVTLPFDLGETVRFEATGLQAPEIDGQATLSGPEGVRLAVINRRGGDPTTVMNLPIHIEDLGCGPTLVGNCLLAMPATLVFDVGGRNVPVAHTGDTLSLGGWTVHVARVYRDANACEPGLHDLYANLLLTWGRP